MFCYKLDYKELIATTIAQYFNIFIRNTFEHPKGKKSHITYETLAKNGM